MRATPENAWQMVHGLGMRLDRVARTLGVSKPSVLELLERFQPIALDREYKAMVSAGMGDPNLIVGAANCRGRRFYNGSKVGHGNR